MVNVSAPATRGLSYEKESYRITLALTEHCPIVPTELGTLDDLVTTVARKQPTGIHYSGHGAPGMLEFEDDEGRSNPVSIAALIEGLRGSVADARLPPFFYLASCHGNTPGAPEEGKPGAESSAARLHRAGVTQVVGYFGPILDELSTLAEETLYAAIAEGHPTSHAVHLARQALVRSFAPTLQAVRDVPLFRPAGATTLETHPFAWSQLVFYHRGPELPLGLPAPAGRRKLENVPHRTFEDAGTTRRILTTGFIGRRGDLHRIRKAIREGQRIFVLQGLGGLGKSTLALHMLPLIGPKELHCILWCQDAEKYTEGNDPVAEALVGQLLEYCRRRLGADWEGVVQEVDRIAGDDSAQRFAYFLGALLEKVPQLVLYLDNLESLLAGPDDLHGGDDAAFGEWRSQGLAALWAVLAGYARDGDKLHVIASCRYRHDDFSEWLIPVSPLPGDALFRLMEWFPGLRRLSGVTRARLVDRLAGHPRAVEFADDLVNHGLKLWIDRHGPWRLPERPGDDDFRREWSGLVEPLLPRVYARLRDDLLFDAIWDDVLDEDARRMLYRMTLLRRPWPWSLMTVLGEPESPSGAAEATADDFSHTGAERYGGEAVAATGICTK